MNQELRDKFIKEVRGRFNIPAEFTEALEEIHDAAYWEGREEGFSRGYDCGHSEGYNEGEMRGECSW
jgi:flagellar biosynthesis/type III secretory pathway protein FliH